MCKAITESLTGYMRASFPLVYITSAEEDRVERIVGKVCGTKLSDGETELAKLFVWEEGVGIKAASKSLKDTEINFETLAEETGSLPDFIRKLVDVSTEARSAMDSGSECVWTDACFLAKDLHYLFLNPNPMMYRALRVFARNAKAAGMYLIAVGPPVTLPAELSHEFVVIDCDLPDRGDIETSLKELGESLESAGQGDVLLKTMKSTKKKAEIVEAATGMTENEVTGSVSLSLVTSGTVDRKFVADQKIAAVKKSGFLEIYPTEEIGNVGGLDQLKNYLGITEKAFSDDARKFGIGEPKGVLMVGIAGTGKSLCAKAAASVFKRPLLRFDIAAAFGSLVGQSESNMRQAIKTAEAAAPCVLFVDEIEKALSGGGGGGDHDGGTTVRVMGTFLSWMQDHKTKVYVVATANQVNSLPPELLRKGRFDEIFFCDLPSDGEREEIWKIHLTKVGRLTHSDYGIPELVKASEGYSGSEIEQAVHDGLRSAFSEGAQDVTPKHLLDAVKRTKPLSQTRSEDIKKMREHGIKNFRAASSDVAADVCGTKAVRRIKTGAPA